MYIADLIQRLQRINKMYGNLPVSIDSGVIKTMRVTPTVDGVAHPIDLNDVNELHLTIQS